MSKIQGRIFSVIVYEESFSFPSDVDSFFSSFEAYAYILHDKDLNDDGTQKKSHYHIIVKYSSPRLLSTVASYFGVAENMVEVLRKWKSSCRYLLHLDHPNKAQYSFSDLKTNIPSSYFSFNDGQVLKELHDYVINAGYNGLSYSSILSWVVDNGYYSIYLKYYRVFSDIYKEVYNCRNK